MRAYLLTRLSAMALTLLGVSVLVFAMIRLIPGTVVEQLLGQAAIASPEVLASFRRFFGLDRPLHVQYLDWLGGVLRGDLGTSWLSGRPVLALFLERVPVSAELAVLAVGWSLCLGIPLGVASAMWPGGTRDGLIRVLATLGLALPAFWQGTVLILVFSVYLGWMPSLQWVPFLRDPAANLLIMALPALTLGTATAAMITRMSRSSMLDVLGREFVRTAQAKGLPDRRVTYHHALRNALIPVVTVAGVQLGYVVGGLVVVEDVFTLPGVGRLLLDAIFQRDYPVVQGVILLLAATFMALNLPWTSSTPSSTRGSVVARAGPARALARAGPPSGAGRALPGRRCSWSSWRSASARSGSPPTRRRRSMPRASSRRRARATGWAPTASGGTSSRASSSACGSRWGSRGRRSRSRSPWGARSASWPASAGPSTSSAGA